MVEKIMDLGAGFGNRQFRSTIVGLIVLLLVIMAFKIGRAHV